MPRCAARDRPHDEGRPASAAPFGPGRDLRWSNPHRGGPDRRSHGADRAGLGGEVQRPGARGLDQPQAARPARETHRHASRGPAGHRRARAHSGDPWRGALAVGRSDRMGLGGVPDHHLQADLEPRVAGSGLSQALGPSAPSCPERGGGGRFQKDCPARLEEIAKAEAHGKVIEIWFADEARIGQKNKITQRWAKRGTRPSAPKDQRTASAYIFGAICPAEGKGAGLVLPRCTTEGMTLHLKEIAQAVAPGAHALVLVDQAGWHQSKRLGVPDNITLVPLPAKAPELNPVENIWQYMRENWISNRIFASYSDILDHCCEAWNKLTDRPWLIMSIGLRDWAHRF